MQTCATFLGIIFDNKLTWSEHIRYIEERRKSATNLCGK